MTRVPPDVPGGRRLLARLLQVGSWGSAAPLAVVSTLRLLHIGDQAPVAVLLAVLTPWSALLLLAGLVASVAALALRRRAAVVLLVGLTVALLALHAAWLAPTLLATRAVPAAARAAGADRLRVLAINVEYSNRRGDLVAAEVARLQPDVVVVSEANPVSLPPLLAAPTLAAYPHRFLAPSGSDDTTGSALFSRYALQDAQVWDCAGQPMTRATVVLPRGARVRLYQVHTAAPTEGGQAVRWRAQLAALSGAVRAETGAGGDVVVAGDFNASRDTRPFTGLLDTGLADASDALGRGPWHPTWRVGRLLPRLLRLDHVLVSARVAVLGAGGTRPVGSDHVGVTADLALPGR